MTEPVLRLEGVRRSYESGGATKEVLRGIDLTIGRAEFTALIGPSGSGKSTLLNLIGLLDRPSAGHVLLGGRRTRDLTDDDLTRLRGEELGFIFQFHHLIPSLTAVENVMLPLALRRGRIHDKDREEARRVLRAVGLEGRGRARPRELSGGQQQRVAVARALIGKPSLVLADEPTGNLDTESSQEVFSLFRTLHRAHDTAFLLVTHDEALANACDRALVLVDGRIVEDRLRHASPR